MNFRQSKYLSAAIIALMMMAFMIKAAIPAGFMPSSEGGFTKLVICSGMGEKTILLPNDDTGENDHSDSSKHLCAYQILAGQNTVPTPDEDISPDLDIETIHYEWTVTAALIQHKILSSFARGPPTV